MQYKLYLKDASIDSMHRFISVGDLAIDFYQMIGQRGEEMVKIAKLESHIRKREDSSSRVTEIRSTLRRSARNFDKDSL